MKSGFGIAKYIYNDQGKWIECVLYKPDGNIDEKYISLYDKKGNVINKTSYDSEGHTIRNFTWSYEYDSHGNWIKKTEGGDFDDPAMVVREIKYY